jgi:nitrate reductase delta subunit
MLELNAQQELCQQFAALLSYPDECVAAQTKTCLKLMRVANSEGVSSLETFLHFVETNSSCRIEEAFTGTFDLQSLCHPYVGYQLCGESQQRTIFMLKLREIYQNFAFTPGNELPDHMTEVLRFLGFITDQSCRLEIIRDGLLPAIDKITQGIECDKHPYMALLNALERFLQETVRDVSGHDQTDRQKEYLS